MDKRVRNKHTRKTQKERLDAIMEKKPTANLLQSRGIPVETLNKQIKSNFSEKQNKLVQQRVKNSKKKRYRPQQVEVSRSGRPGNFQAPQVQEIPLPDWLKTTSQDIDVSIIVPMYRSSEYIKLQIESWVLEDDGLKKEIIYIDDCCPQKSYEHVIQAWESRKKELSEPLIRIFTHSKNSGFGVTCNTGADQARGKYLIFLNADTKVTPGWVRPMYDCFEDQTIGLVGNLHLKMDSNRVDSLGSEWHWGHKAFLHIGRSIDEGEILRSPYNLEDLPERLLKMRDVQMVTGACFMIPASLFKKIDGFDTGYRIGYWEDSDLNMKVHAHGYRVVCQPASRIHHKVSHSKVGYHGHMIENQKLFYEKWIDTKIMEGYIDTIKPNGKRASVSEGSIVVYTAITGEYDSLKNQKHSDSRTPFVAFLDEPPRSTKTWEYKPVWNEFSDFNRNAKIHKILSHKFFPDYEYSLWIDGSVVIEFPFSVERLAEIYLAEHDMAIFKHPDRNCIYQEANVCMQRKLDNPDIIRKQIEKYTMKGYPSNAGLVEATIILRRHTPKIINFNEAWWDEIKEGSKRDQISFNYVAHKMGIKYKLFPGTLRNENYLFRVGRHNKKR